MFTPMSSMTSSTPAYAYDNNNDDNDDRTPPSPPQPTGVTTTTTTTMIIIPKEPERGISAWLDYMNRNNRDNTFTRLKNILFKEG